jgi:hypothetical protein
MTPARIAEAAEAFKMLDPLNVSLLDAVRHYIAGHNRRNQSVTLEELFNQCIASKQGAHKKYIKDMREVLNKFSGLKQTVVADVETSDIEQALNGVTNGARNNALKVARTVTNYGIDRLQDNPVRKSSFAKRPKHDREIIPADKVSTILSFGEPFASRPAIVAARGETFGGRLQCARPNRHEFALMPVDIIFQCNAHHVPKSVGRKSIIRVFIDPLKKRLAEYLESFKPKILALPGKPLDLIRR